MGGGVVLGMHVQRTSRGLLVVCVVGLTPHARRTSKELKSPSFCSREESCRGLWSRILCSRSTLSITFSIRASAPVSTSASSSAGAFIIKCMAIGHEDCRLIFEMGKRTRPLRRRHHRSRRHRAHGIRQPVWDATRPGARRGGTAADDGASGRG